MNRTIQIAPVRKSVVVDATPAEAFEFFTGKIDRWWPKQHTIGATPLVESIIEPFVGGRWYSKHQGGEESVVGHVVVWQPGARFIVTWEISGEWKSDPRAAFTSEVEVRFIAESPARTRVELEHRNFERMESGGQTMRDGVDSGWPGILELYVTKLGDSLSTR
jgi:Activator of Hsp90 ATPase homolog 1-like protein